MTRVDDVHRFYTLMDRLENIVGGKRKLATANGRMVWPRRGVYFFFEPGEERTTSGNGLRVVRVGTHALQARSRTTLWKRLLQHRGSLGGENIDGGNHRGSIFRLHVGTALIQRDQWSSDVAEQWGIGSSALKAVQIRERPLERAVSQHIRQMPFLWLAVEDDPGPNSMRGYIERNAIALLSNYTRRTDPIDPPSVSWLGHWAKSKEIESSGLWNVQHVEEFYAQIFLDKLEAFVERQTFRVNIP